MAASADHPTYAGCVCVCVWTALVTHPQRAVSTFTGYIIAKRCPNPGSTPLRSTPLLLSCSSPSCIVRLLWHVVNTAHKLCTKVLSYKLYYGSSQAGHFMCDRDKDRERDEMSVGLCEK